MNSDKIFKTDILVNCIVSAIYLSYSSTCIYYFNKGSHLSTLSEEFNSMFIISIILTVLSFIALSYFSYKLIMLETENTVKEVPDVAELADFDLEKYAKNNKIPERIFEPDKELMEKNVQEKDEQEKDIPEKDVRTIGPGIGSGNF